MSNINIIGEKHMTMVELKDELERIKKRDEELNFRAQRTQEYLEAVSPLKKKQADELIKKLETLDIQRLKPEHISKIIDLGPRTLEELKTIMAAYVVTLTNDNLKKIVDAVNEILD
ncbi:hypothetical protein COV93_00650 [Candidatus Woesearchaeota archaeon CG11_big_fil_rev_8_21_14_0_20_43_8]|nr:MAG: hypothetical protein COV93_00650 [Candidatus Woesearchaeota archaeon CG11_big_fil_rev_8_21_14_0_20_43_8]PIO06793.1 MAG: hypothetical protein COT47_02685 [Candidatus Woesearchaeota archaeon CG08_land_8_20_14_0_20_43_7]